MDELVKSVTDYIPQLVTIADKMKYVFLVYAGGLLIEYFIPAQRGQSSENIRFNMVYTVVFIVMNTLLFGLFIQFKQPVVDFFGGPYFELSFSGTWWGQLLHVLAFLFVFDFFYYWFHRWQHTIKPLWAQHALHHSDEALNITTGNRHHWLEDSLRIFVILIPMDILFSFSFETVGLIWATFLLWGYFIHLNIRLNLGWLTPVFGGPQLHRIHHSNQEPHLDKNFAAFFPVFDVLFGTFYWPKKDEYPTTGLYGGFNMNNMKTANFYPFQYWFGRIKQRLTGGKHPQQ
jgi:sterol desaturase/sphingolipid hydroxylase (fatty acid hydroxylase superfamily)